jgi:hypothetical protein
VDEWLDAVIKRSQQVFIEIHRYGDGPGSVRFQNDLDVYNYLKTFVATEQIKRLCSLPVHGRNATRTVWSVSK